MLEPGAAGAAFTPKQEKAVAEGKKTLVEGVEKLGVKQPIALNTTLDTLEGGVVSREVCNIVFNVVAHLPDLGDGLQSPVFYEPRSG